MTCVTLQEISHLQIPYGRPCLNMCLPIKKFCKSWRAWQAAQVFAFKYQLSLRYSTIGRWIEISRHVESLREIALLAQEAYDFLLRLRTMNGLKRGDSGRFIDPEKLTKMEKAQLVNVFDVVRMVQDTLRNEFRLDPLRR